MSDWEKRKQLLDAVVTCREMLNPPGYRMTDCSVDCPYYEKRAEKQCVKAMLEDTEALIRGLEPVKPDIGQVIDGVYAVCANCRYSLKLLFDAGGPKIGYSPRFCPECGREVKWDG
jgi:hypothetical protein